MFEIQSTTEIIDTIIQLVQYDPEYPSIKEAYENACRMIPTNKMKKIQSAYEQRIRAAFIFCANLGLQENLTLFIDPLRKSFLAVDPDIYLQESKLFNMPPYRKTAEEIRILLKDLSLDCSTAITEYYVYLEMNAERIAHYKGFLYGNELLLYTHPGYSPNLAIAYQYKQILPEILGYPLPE